MKLSKKNSISATFVIAGLVGFTAPAWSHDVTPAADGDIEASKSYIANDGKVIKTGIGECLRSSGWNADEAAPGCEGGEVEAKAPEPVEEVKQPEAPKQVAKVETISVDGVGLFATNSDQLTGEGMAKIDDLLAKLADFKGILGIEISGHTDDRGSEEYNQELSQRRAETVQTLLAARYPDVPINAVGLGESAPVADNGTAEGRQANRRVEVAVNASRMTFE